MEITPYEGMDPPPINWVDRNTVKNVQCVISNIFLSNYRASLQYTGLVNFPLRVWNCAGAFQDKDYWKVAFDVLAFTVLFFPAGRQVAIAVDLISETVNVYKKIQKGYPGRVILGNVFNILGMNTTRGNIAPSKEYPDCTVRENALKVLGLTEEQSQNPDTLNERYQRLLKAWNDRIVKAQKSPLLLQKFQEMKNLAEIAYQTLSDGKQN